MATVQAGVRLSVSQGGWANMGGANPIFSYQWQRDGVDIPGATTFSYLTQAIDVGHAIGCNITASNDGGSAIAAASNPATVTTGTPPIIVVGTAKTYLVEVGWGQSQTGLFTFGVSQFGSTDDLLASVDWSAVFQGPLSDLTDRTRNIQIVRGRDDYLSTMQAGQLTLTGVDPDGALNVRNPASPLAGFIYTGVPIRVSAYSSTGIKKGLFYGFINTLTSDPARGESRYGTFQISATDFYSKLRGQRPVLGPLAGMTTGSLIEAFLSSLDWTDPSLIDLDAGDAIPSPYTRTDGTNDLLSLVEEALTSERGYFFIGGDGAVNYRSRYQILTQSSLTTLDRVMSGAPSALDDSRVVTRWTVTRVAMDGSTAIGVPQVAAVAAGDASLRRYGYVDGSISSPTIVDDNQALALAEYLLANTKAPSGVGWQVPIVPPDDATFDEIISRDLGDRVTLAVDPSLWGSYTQDYLIQQITHNIVTDPTQTRHTTTWGVSEFPAGRVFQFGVSQMGGSDYLAY